MGKHAIMWLVKEFLVQTDVRMNDLLPSSYIY